MIMSRPGDDNRVSNSDGVFTPEDGQPSTARRRIANSSVRRRRFNVNERAALQERRPGDTVVACGPGGSPMCRKREAQRLRSCL